MKGGEPVSIYTIEEITERVRPVAERKLIRTKGESYDFSSGERP